MVKFLPCIYAFRDPRWTWSGGFRLAMTAHVRIHGHGGPLATLFWNYIHVSGVLRVRDGVSNATPRTKGNG